MATTPPFAFREPSNLTTAKPGLRDPAGTVAEDRRQDPRHQHGQRDRAGAVSVRDQAKGLDSLVVDSPKTITPDVSVDPYDGPTDFTLRKVQIHLADQPGAAQPVLRTRVRAVPQITSGLHRLWLNYSFSVAAV